MSGHPGEFLPPLVAGLVYLYAYHRRLGKLAENGREPPSWRAKTFTFGVFTAILVQLPPFDGLADSVLIAHMIQHIIIGDICSLLIVLGFTGPMLAPLLRTRLARLTRRLAHPIVALVLWAVDLYAWHLPSSTSSRSATTSSTHSNTPACCRSGSSCGPR